MFNFLFCILLGRSTWGTNQWSRGSYSFRALKSQTMGAWPADLAEPLLGSKKDNPVSLYEAQIHHISDLSLCEFCVYAVVYSHGISKKNWMRMEEMILYSKGRQLKLDHVDCEIVSGSYGGWNSWYTYWILPCSYVYLFVFLLFLFLPFLIHIVISQIFWKKRARVTFNEKEVVIQMHRNWIICLSSPTFVHFAIFQKFLVIKYQENFSF